MDKKNCIVMYSLILVIILGCLIFSILNKETSVLVDGRDTELYNIIYDDESIPGSRYDISIYSDRFEVDVTRFCSALDCEPTMEDTEVFRYSEANMKKLFSFVENYLGVEKYSSKELWLNDYDDYGQDVIRCLTLDEYLFEVAVEEYKYTFSYGASDYKEYHFYFKDDESILVKVLKSNDDYDLVGVDTYNVDFSKKNTKMLFDYAKKLTNDNNGHNYHKSGSLYKNEKNIYLSLVKNDESYLEALKVELLYEITYNGLNCHTPYIRLYSDDTYEYYYTYALGNNSPTPKIGIFDYDIEKITDSVDDYEENNRGPFIISSSSGKEYVTYDTNIYLNEFLDKYDFNLQTCVTFEE